MGQRVSLTQRTITALPPPAMGQRTYVDAKLPGFGVRVSASGHRSWVAVYRHRGRVRRFTLGPCALLDAETARTQAFDILARARRGEDPAAEKQAQRRAETFGELAALYLAKHAAAKKRDAGARDRARLEKDVLPRWRHLQAATIQRRDVRHLLEAIVERGAPISANRALALIRKVFNFGIERELLTTNPCQGVKPPAPEHQRERVLRAEELRAVWQAAAREDPDTCAFFRLAVLTAQRGGELKTMRWTDLDLDERVWTIPAERAKNGKAHRVPLSPPATAILLALKPQGSGAPWVFPSDSGAGHRATLQNAVRRLHAASGTTEWTPHDLRRSAASHMAALGIARLVIGRILNHVEPGVTKVYDRHSYDAEKRQALDAWARRLEAIVTSEKLPKIVPLRAG